MCDVERASGGQAAEMRSPHAGQLSRDVTFPTSNVLKLGTAREIATYMRSSGVFGKLGLLLHLKA